ncbi:hypothetical protein CVT24_001285 [Panaeolus cyanescens]|uniref:RBR-type E3 ubiquitin transferase n=1 Tax=Panaeolus cyanescens TaxID=181874 RepID=A0A409YZ97_9AGAR|nr:hypothetical protein CVT24_001285 [Panaeolus cyanescens]
MSTETATNNQMSSKVTSRRTKRRNPARARDGQNAASGPAQAELQQPKVVGPSKPLSRVDYKPEPDFNAHDIVPVNKPCKSLSRLAEAANSNKSSSAKLPIARIDDDPSPSPSDRGDAVADDQASISKSSAVDVNHQVVVIAYGIEAHITRASINQICWKFVSKTRYCPYGILCQRIHPKDKTPYADQADEQIRRFGEEKDKLRGLQDLSQTLRDNAKSVGAIRPAASKGSDAPATIDRSDSTASSASSSSSPSTPSLSLSSITTSSQISLAESSTPSSEFYSATSCSSSSTSSPKAQRSSIPDSSPGSVESPLDTPTMNPKQMSLSEVATGKGKRAERESERVQAPRFYSSTIDSRENALHHRPTTRSNSLDDGDTAILSTSPDDISLSADLASSSAYVPQLPQQHPLPNKPAFSAHHNNVRLSSNHINHIASHLQHQASQRLTSGYTPPMPGSTHPRQHFRDKSMPTTYNLPNSNYEYRNRSQSVTNNVPLPPRFNAINRHQPNNMHRPLQPPFEVETQSPIYPNAQHDISRTSYTGRSSTLEPEKTQLHVTSNTNSWGFQPGRSEVAPTQAFNPPPVSQMRRPHNPSHSTITFVPHPPNHKPLHTIHAGFKHAVHAHLNPGYDKSLQRIHVDTLPYYIPNSKIRATFGPGFTLVDIVTGMDSCWVYIRGFPARWTGAKIYQVLGEFGEVTELHELSGSNTGPPLKVQFKKESDALNAIRRLHGRVIEGKKVEISLGLKTGKNEDSVVRNATVQVDITIPYVNIWVGYETEEASLAAVERARTTPFHDFLTTAEPYQGLPAVGFKTVKFTVPGFMKADDMQMFGENEGVVTALSYRDTPYPTLDAVQSALDKHLEKINAKGVKNVKLMPGPYRNGFIRFNIKCDDGNAAQRLAQQLDRWFLQDIARIYSRRVFSLVITVEKHKYQRSAAQIAELSLSAKKLGYGHGIDVDDRGHSTAKIHITATEFKSLGLLKSQVDKVYNGTVVTGPDGRWLWDDSFDYGPGVKFVQELERRYAPVTIRRDITRRNIRVYGPEGKAALARRAIQQNILALRKWAQRSIPLPGALWSFFCDGPFQDLEDDLGADAIQLEYSARLLHIRGSDKVYEKAALAVQEARRKLRARQHGINTESDCPACFSAVTNPVKLLCGHEYCRECLQQYLNTAVVMKFFPLACHGNGGKCNEKIALDIARRILAPSHWDQVVGAALKDHVQRHPDEFHYCPTPDCNEIYRPAPEGIVYTCPSCYLRICPNCDGEEHENLTCAEVKEGVGEYRVWAEKHNVKQCPKCKTFPDGGSAIYDHMRDNHGGMGLVPDVEEIPR